MGPVRAGRWTAHRSTLAVSGASAAGGNLRAPAASVQPAARVAAPTSATRVQVAAGLLMRGGRVMVALRKNGLWEFPGGKLELGETYLMALIRELKEECGIVVLGSPRRLVSHETGDRLMVHVYLIQEWRNEPQGLDWPGQPIQWLAPEEAFALSATPSTYAALTALAAIELPPVAVAPAAPAAVAADA